MVKIKKGTPQTYKWVVKSMGYRWAGEQYSLLYLTPSTLE